MHNEIVADITLLYVMVIDGVEYNSGRNLTSKFKLAEHVARGRFEVTSTITQLPINRTVELLLTDTSLIWTPLHY